jgi:hypothetical protein
MGESVTGLNGGGMGSADWLAAHALAHNSNNMAPKHGREAIAGL